MFSSSRLKSQIWLHFTSADEEKKVKCLYCGQKLSIANKSTCSLIRHMHKKHPKQYIVRKAHPESKYNVNVQESKRKDGYFYKKSISIKKQKEIDRLLKSGEKHEYIPPGETLDKVAGILGPNCDDYKVHFDDDMVNVIVVEQEQESTEESAVTEQPMTLLLETETDRNHQILGPPEISPHAPNSKMYFASNTRKGKQKSQILVDEIKRSVKEKNLAIAKYYDSKRKHEEELHFLRKKKLQLEIVEKETKILKPID